MQTILLCVGNQSLNEVVNKWERWKNAVEGKDLRVINNEIKVCSY